MRSWITNQLRCFTDVDIMLDFLYTVHACIAEPRLAPLSLSFQPSQLIFNSIVHIGLAFTIGDANANANAIIIIIITLSHYYTNNSSRY